MTEVDIHAPGVECIRTQCYFCHANCGVLAYVKDGNVIKIEGDPDYTNQGGLCCRGTSALLHVHHPGRVNHVLKRAGEKGEGKWEQVDYDQAIQEVADRLNQIKAENGAESVASCGGTTRTDDWARRRFLNQFGTPNGFHNALLCWIPTFMAETAVAGWSPFETDLGGAKSLILWGMNPGASSLPSMHGYWDLIHNGMKTIVVDPRYSETAAKADLWLPLLPGSDCALALSLLYCAVMEGLCNFEFCGTWCDGFDDLMGHLGDYTPEWASEITGLDPELIRKAAAMYCTNTPGCIQWGCTWDQLGRASTTTSHALQLLRAVTGNLEIPGGDGMPGPAMNYLCDEELELNELLPDEIKSKQIGSNKFKLASWPGYTKISKMNKRTWGKTLPAEWFCEAHGPSVFKAILTKDPYEVRALIVNASNPMMSYGDSKMVLAAIKAVEFLVVVDYWITPTALFADYVFPAAGALERPVIITHYGATDSLMGGRRAMQPLYDRHTDMTFWRKLGLACGQDPANWPWETEEEAYWAIMEPIGLPVSSYNEFVDKIRMYYPPLHQSKYINRGGFWTPSGKVELDSSILKELGYPGMPTYLGSSENPIDDPELAEEYPIRLTTGGGFMPFHHSEHFNMPYTRYLSPDPYFSINPELAEKLGIKERDWCWIETRRGRIKMRADVDNVVDPRVVFAPRGWWFPERDGSADLDNPFGCLESNVNTLTSVDDEHCDPMGGSWANRGLLCKVYKCTPADHEYTYEDTKWSIPGSDPRKGKTFEDAVHRMPSDFIKAREDVPFEAPAYPGGEVPEGYEYQWQDNSLYHIATNYKVDPSGWLINPANKAYYDAYTLWRYDSAAEQLVDDATGKRYTMNREPIEYWGSLLCYPGKADPAYELPAGIEWNQEKGIGMAFGHPYDVNSGWCIDPETNVYYDALTGLAYDPTQNVLVDMVSGYHYDMTTRQPIDGGPVVYQPAETPRPDGLPDTVVWDPTTATGTAFGHPYDMESGWCIDPTTNVYYDVYTGLAYDASRNVLMDEATGYTYDMTTREPLDGGPNVMGKAAEAAAAEAFPRPEGLPETVEWDGATGKGTAFGHPYDQESGWCIEASGVYYDVYTGLAYDAANNNLVNEATGYHYDLTTREPLDGGPSVLGAAAEAEAEPAAEAEAVQEVVAEPEPEPVAEVAPAVAAVEEEKPGEILGAAPGYRPGKNGLWYEESTGYRWDSKAGNLIDEATGMRYDRDTHAELGVDEAFLADQSAYQERLQSQLGVISELSGQDAADAVAAKVAEAHSSESPFAEEAAVAAVAEAAAAVAAEAPAAAAEEEEVTEIMGAAEGYYPGKNGLWYEEGTGYRWDSKAGNLIDEATGMRYDRNTRAELGVDEAFLADQAAYKDRLAAQLGVISELSGQDAADAVAAKVAEANSSESIFAKKGGTVVTEAAVEAEEEAKEILGAAPGYYPGKNGLWYEEGTGYRWDSAQGNLLDEKTGMRYDRDTRAELGVDENYLADVAAYEGRIEKLKGVFTQLGKDVEL